MARPSRFLLTLAILLTAGTSLADVRTFQCRFRPAREAAAVAEPLLSPDGSVEIQPKLNAIVVHDNAEVLQKVAGALAAWDAAPSKYSVRVRLIMATTAPPREGKPGAKLEGLGSELVNMFNFSSFEELESLELVAADGSSMDVSVGKLYRVRMSLKSIPGEAGRLRLAPFELLRREGLDKGVDVTRSLLRSTVSLKAGQTGILIAANSEGAKKALIVVLAAEPEKHP